MPLFDSFSFPSPFYCPPSKSFTHRALLLAALSEKKTVINNFYPCLDTAATLGCLKQLGASFTVSDGRVCFSPSPLKNPVCPLDCGESASTLRFLVPVLCSRGIDASLILHTRNGGRISVDEFAGIGGSECVITVSHGNGHAEVTIKNGSPLTGKTVGASRTSQVLTGALLSLCPFGGYVFAPANYGSRPYTEITLSALGQFGCECFAESGKITVRAAKAEDRELTLPGDWSFAAFPLIAGITGNKPVSVCGLSPRDPQGDKAVTDIIRSSGGRVEFENGVYTAYPSDTAGFTADCSDTPDLAPALAVLAANSNGQSLITGLNRLTLKESDRIQSVRELISPLCAVRVINGDALCITPNKKDLPSSPVTVSTSGDHRIALAALTLAVTRPVFIDDTACAAKSLPQKTISQLFAPL